MRKVLGDPEVVRAFSARGMGAIPGASDVSAAEIAPRIGQCAPIVKATGTTPD